MNNSKKYFDVSSFLNNARVNLPIAELYEYSLKNQEALLTSDGALCINTGEHTGRSPQDKYIVFDTQTENNIDWKQNKKINPEQFKALFESFKKYSQDKNLFLSQLNAASASENQLSCHVYTELAIHSIFITNLLKQDKNLKKIPNLTIINLANLNADYKKIGLRSKTAVAVDFTNRIILICGTSYAGEIKKSVFTFLNYLLPQKNILPMHCSANEGANKKVNIFFGLSGTGKTTLSSNPDYKLIGDDEHGWDDNGVYNIENGCYAKTANLCAQQEPLIYNSTRRFGSILENVKLDDQRCVHYDDLSMTENARAAYPLAYIKNTKKIARGEHPNKIILLTADAYGVLPPIAKLNPLQATYFFLSGYTSKIAGTEKGIKEPIATFSTCFGAPFMPLLPSDYGKLFYEKISIHNSQCWLLNTGWTNGGFKNGPRIPLNLTRQLLDLVLNDKINLASFNTDSIFLFSVPSYHPDINDCSVFSSTAGFNKYDEYEKIAQNLKQEFINNYKNQSYDETYNIYS